MRLQDSETNIIVLNTAIKIQRNTQKPKYIKYTKYKHILQEPVQKPDRSIAPRERLKAYRYGSFRLHADETQGVQVKL